MTPPRRKAPAKSKATSGRKGGRASRPLMSPKDLREAAKQDIARVKELDALYRPLREAGEARLARTKSGRKALEETRAFGMEQAELYTSIGAGKTPYEEGHRLARHRQEDFRQRYEEQLIEAQAPDARLQPSVEAVAQILAPEFGPQTHWIAETAPLRALLLQPKPAPEDLGRVSQGLGDPAPEPVSICRRYPYSRREEYPLASGLTGEVLAVAELGGKIDVDGWVITGAGVPQGVIGSAWLGHDFDVPEGIFRTRRLSNTTSFLGGLPMQSLGSAP